MRSVGDWKILLRAELKRALVARHAHVAAVLRETLAAIDNAEAPPMSAAPAGQGSASFAGSVAGLGAGEVPRLRLTPDEVAAIVAREIAERRRAAAEYTTLGRPEEATTLTLQSEVLLALLGG